MVLTGFTVLAGYKAKLISTIVDTNSEIKKGAGYKAKLISTIVDM